MSESPHRRRTKRCIACLAIIGAVSSCAGPAQSGSLTSACVNKSTGGVRVLINGGTCTASEVPITWGHEVIDATGKLIGSVISENRVVRQVKGIWFSLMVKPSGFAPTDFLGITYEYTTSDCSGSAYLHSGDLIEFGLVSGTTLHYGAPPFRQLTLKTEKCVGSGCFLKMCQTFSTPFQDTVGVATSFDLSNLGFTPPFRLQ